METKVGLGNREFPGEYRDAVLDCAETEGVRRAVERYVPADG
jgi:hypothetical protein